MCRSQLAASFWNPNITCSLISIPCPDPIPLYYVQVITSYIRRSPTNAFAVSDAHSMYLYVINDDPSSRPLSLDVSKWATVAVGGTVIINQVLPLCYL